MTERSIAQFTLIEALAFVERAGILLCAVLFLIHKNKDFLTISGFAFVFLHIFLLSPVYAIIFYIIERGIYKFQRKKGGGPRTIEALKSLCRRVYYSLLPLMTIATCQLFILYYQVISGLHLDLAIR